MVINRTVMTYLDPDATLWKRTVELFWICILFMGYPAFMMIEWLFWEIYGKGPRRDR